MRKDEGDIETTSEYFFATGTVLEIGEYSRNIFGYSPVLSIQSCDMFRPIAHEQKILDGL